MIAKGHDFPRVTLVGVVDADVGLGMPDFRSAERTFQLLTQVAGRAGRGETAGEVVLQSHMPDHYALGHACAQDYDAFYERELEFRRTMGYPPVAALVNLIVRATDAAKGAAEAEALASALRAAAAGRYRVLGPAHAPLARLRNEHRFQVLLKGHRPAMRAAVRAALVDALRPPALAGHRRRRRPADRHVTHRSQPVDPQRLEEVAPGEDDRVRARSDTTKTARASEPHPRARAPDRRLVVEGRRVRGGPGRARGRPTGSSSGRSRRAPRRPTSRRAR